MFIKLFYTDYLESSDNMIHSLMMRHQTLNELNTNLLLHRDDLNKQVYYYYYSCFLSFV